LNYGLQDIELGCKGVCGHIQRKDIQETCSITCDALGLYAFVKLVSTRDIDPIYYCEGLSSFALCCQAFSPCSCRSCILQSCTPVPPVPASNSNIPPSAFLKRALVNTWTAEAIVLICFQKAYRHPVAIHKPFFMPVLSWKSRKI
jgi:hypothetical protein